VSDSNLLEKSKKEIHIMQYLQVIPALYLVGWIAKILW